MKKLIIASLVATSLIASASVLAKPGQHGHHKPVFAELGLSDTQKQDIGEIMRQLRQDNSVYRGEKQNIRQDMQDLMQMPSWDESKAESLISQNLENAKQVRLNTATAKHQAYNVLTLEQQEAFISGKEDKRKERKPGKQLKRMEKRLGLTDEQSSQIDAIFEAQQAQLESYKEDIKAHKQAERALIAATSFDENAYNELNEAFQDTQIQIELIKTKTRYDIYQVLTPEQQEKLANKERGQRKQKMKNRRKNSD